MSHDCLQVEILERIGSLGNHPYCVRLACPTLQGGQWSKNIGGTVYKTVMLQPVCEPLQRHTPLRHVVQAAHDISISADWLDKIGINHRDISSGNIHMVRVSDANAMDLDGGGDIYGCLLDFSASQVRQMYRELPRTTHTCRLSAAM